MNSRIRQLRIDNFVPIYSSQKSSFIKPKKGKKWKYSTPEINVFVVVVVVSILPRSLIQYATNKP